MKKFILIAILIIVTFFVQSSYAEYIFDNLPCDDFFHPTEHTLPNDEDCKIRARIAFGSIYDDFKYRQKSLEEILQFLNELYDRLKKTDAKWPKYLHLADDILYYQIRYTIHELSESQIEAVISKLKSSHPFETICMLQLLGDDELFHFFGGHSKENNITHIMSQLSAQFYVEKCANNTYYSTLLLAVNHYKYLNDYNKAISLSLDLLSDAKPHDYNSSIGFAKIEGHLYTKKVGNTFHIIPSRYSRLINRYYYIDNPIAKTIPQLLSLYLKTNQPSKAIDFIDRYSKYQSLFWLKEVKPLIETYSKDKHLDFQRKLDETIWKAIRDAP